MDLDAALMACPFDERLGETLPDACAPIIATDVHASQHTEGHRLAGWARLCGVPSDQPDDRVVASSNEDNCGVVCEKPPKVSRPLTKRPRHVGVGIVHASILREEQSFEFDERFKVTLVGELHNRHHPHRSDGSDGRRDEFRPGAVKDLRSATARESNAAHVVEIDNDFNPAWAVCLARYGTTTSSNQFELGLNPFKS
jgi:hypothetical protein